jgi:membrane protein implicated in regulation of membrane protease activity
MQWWAWLLLSFGLLASEMLAPGGLYLLFAGIAAGIVGLLSLADLAGPAWSQWLLFALLAGLSLTVLRSRLSPALLAVRFGDGLVGQQVEITTLIEPEGFGKASFRGSTWKVRNAGSRALEVGAHCRIDAVHGITLTVASAAGELGEIE